ncbi:diacylglycerol kinase family protein [soil metagenome]
MTEPAACANKYVIVCNPESRVSPDQVEAEFRRVAGLSVELVVRKTEPGTPMAQIIGADLTPGTIVVAVGGDGTVSAVATVLTGTDYALGIVPGGSTNMVAKVNRVPGGVAAAVKLIHGRHSVERIDVGRCKDRVLLHLGGAGLDARLFTMSSPQLKKRLRWLAYGPPFAKALMEAPARFEITVDGSSISLESRLVLVANASNLIHPRFELMRHVSRTDGVFDILVITADSWVEIARLGGQVMSMRLDKSEHSVRFAGSHIVIQSNPPVPFELDGDVVGETPFEVFVEPQALSVICGPQITRRWDQAER